MNFDDSDKDYFLHDFSKKDGDNADATAVNSESKSEAEPESVATQAPTFSFNNDEARNSDTGKKRSVKQRFRRLLRWIAVIVILLIGVTVWVRYFVPYVTDSQVTGYVTMVEKRGIIFRTFEAELVSESQSVETNRVYARNVDFSIPDEELARKLQQYQGTGHLVTITFKRYYGVLPWRGASATIMESYTPVDSPNF